MSRSPIQVTEDLRIVPGPGLLHHATDPLDLRRHRAHYGALPTLPLPVLHSAVETAQVRGRGGAGFPFARKLRTTADHVRAGRRAVVVVNGSEGEPASAKDAALAEVAPHLVLDGAAATAASLGARDVHVVLPGDRPRARALLAAAVAERDDPRLRWHLHVADSRFVAGQARAVVELLAGRPGLPVTAWEPEAVRGHRGRPTLLSNAETWAHVGLLCLEGPRPTLERGTRTEPGTTLLTVHAPGQRVAVHEVEHGSALAELLPPPVHGGPVLVGGFHGTWASWDTVATMRVSATDLRARGVALGAGVLIAPGPDACALELTTRIVAHLAAQSAGRCGPCRNGLPALASSVRALALGTPDAAVEASRIGSLVTGRGACAHPDGTARLVASLLKTLPGEVEAHARGRCLAGRPWQREAS